MENPILIHVQQCQGTAFPDPRLGKRGASLYTAMAQHQSINIRKISKNRAEQVGYYRFLGNKNVKTVKLVVSLGEHCALQVDGKHQVLAIA